MRICNEISNEGKPAIMVPKMGDISAFTSKKSDLLNKHYQSQSLYTPRTDGGNIDNDNTGQRKWKKLQNLFRGVNRFRSYDITTLTDQEVSRLTLTKGYSCKARARSLFRGEACN